MQGQKAETTKAREFVLGGRNISDRWVPMPERDSFYFPPESLEALISELTSKEYWIQGFNVEYKHVREFDTPSSAVRNETNLPEILGINMLSGNYYITNLVLDGGRRPGILQAFSDTFKLQIENLLKFDSRREVIAAYRYKVYSGSWTQVSVKIKGEDDKTLGIIEGIARKLIVPSKFNYETWDDD